VAYGRDEATMVSSAKSGAGVAWFVPDIIPCLSEQKGARLARPEARFTRGSDERAIVCRATKRQ